MDDLFDLETVTRHPSSSDIAQNDQQGSRHDTGPVFDLDLMLAYAGEDEDSFQILQHFVDPRQHDVQTGNLQASAISPSELLDFDERSPWTRDYHMPPYACRHCHDHQLLCRMSMPWTGDESNVCTSCWTLSNYCDFGTRRSADFHAYKNIPTAEEQVITGGRESHCDDGEFDHTRSTLIATKPAQPADRSSMTKPGPRFSRDTIRILKTWATSHSTHPYPSEQEREDLRKQTGLSTVQITNWLANARRRGLIRPNRPRSTSSNSASSPIPIPVILSDSMDPMERWRRSPPEHEPANVFAIAQAARSGGLPATASRESPYSNYPRSENGSAKPGRDSSASSIDTTRSGSSSRSFHSYGSFSSFGRSGRRRRRPLKDREVAKTNQDTKQARPYHCTFCVEDFKTKHDWQRHEKSMHLSLERWICAPSGGITQESLTPVCVFCQEPRPSEDHLETHNCSSCLNKSADERTFYRKDHLRQHLRLVHNCCSFNSVMEGWKVLAPDIISRCGFCGIDLRTWLSRADHIAEHFKSGASMADWTGDWGLAPEILKLLENSNVPGRHEPSRSPSPFIRNLDSPSIPYGMGSRSDSQYDPTYLGSNQDICMLLLEPEIEADLVDYITTSLQRGFCPSDDDLRIRARGIAGLPSTSFDVSRNLESLKHRCGLAATFDTS